MAWLLQHRQTIVAVYTLVPHLIPSIVPPYRHPLVSDSGFSINDMAPSPQLQCWADKYSRIIQCIFDKDDIESQEEKRDIPPLVSIPATHHRVASVALLSSDSTRKPVCEGWNLVSTLSQC